MSKANNTFLKYSKNISNSFRHIVEVSDPDYIVPVERKGCKLLRWLNYDHSVHRYEIRYRSFFNNTKTDVRGKKVVVIDDASKYTSTLLEYRRYFEKLGAIVDTYSFVGQKYLQTGQREKYDEKATIFRYLEESTYQEYIIQQPIELSREGHIFDIDHLVLRINMSKNRYQEFRSYLSNLGEYDISNDIYTSHSVEKICLYNFTFQINVPFCKEDGIFNSALKKIRFAYDESAKILSIVPLAFVSWDTKKDVSGILAKMPLVLPYEINSRIELEGMYMNILYISNLCLMKCFLQQVTEFSEFQDYCIDEYDLQAYIGKERIHLLKKSISAFFRGTLLFEKTQDINQLHTATFDEEKPKFYSISSVMKYLRDEYERRIEKENKVEGVRFYLTYEELFARYKGRASLMKWIDMLCDRGVLVVRNHLNDNGVYSRVCRSGEGDSDHTERKTALLLPIIINACGKRGEKVYSIKATLLNKVLANLAYDYPNTEYDFHGFCTHPYLYGPQTYVQSMLNEEVQIPLYSIDMISRYCQYDKSRKVFLAANQEIISSEIDSCFSQSDSVSFTEILSYVGLLAELSKKMKKADALNELIICRDQDIYYRHVHFNLTTAFTRIDTAYKSNIPLRKETYSRNASNMAHEAIKKLNYQQQHVFEELKDIALSNIQYREAYKRIEATRVGFSEEFKIKMASLFACANMELALSNIMLYTAMFDKKYLGKSIKYALEAGIKIDQNIEKLNDAVLYDEYNKLYASSKESINAFIKDLYIKLCRIIRSMPKPRETDYVLAKKKNSMNVAINKCIQYIKRKNLTDYVIMQFDFSGFHNVEGSENINIIEQIQRFSSGIMTKEGFGSYIHGEVGTSTNGTLVFPCIENAIHFAYELRRICSSPNFNQVDFRFGCSSCRVRENLQADINTTWKEAYKCCQLMKSDTSSRFLITEETYQQLSKEIKLSFTELTLEGADVMCYNHVDFAYDESERIIHYTKDTDGRIRIGVITALTEEFVAMKLMLKNPKTAVFPSSRSTAIGREYCIGTVQSLDKKDHQVALIQTLGPGNTSAALRAQSLLERFPNLDVIIMTGIAGGIPSPEKKEEHVRLGDIVVSKRIISYDFVSDKKRVEELRGIDPPPSARLLEAQKHLEQNAFLGVRVWERYIDEIEKSYTEFVRPAEETDILYDKRNKPMPHPEDKNRCGYPRVFFEKIASANRVLKNPSKRDKLKEQYGVYAVEMESSGIAEATWEAQIGYYVIRGISDYCDGKKNDLWHNYAALAAAAYTRALIEKIPL